MKKILSYALSCVLAIGMFAGCTANSSSSSSSQPEATASQTEATTAVATQETTTAPETTPAAVTTPSEAPAAEGETQVAALKGPTAMGMVKMMADDQAAGNPSYTFTISAAADEITPKLVQGEIDIAAVPSNLASVLYNNTNGQVKVLAVNTLGVLYIVENGGTIKTAEDLRGKTIYSSGKGGPPEYALNYILKANGIDPEKDVTVEYKAEHAECVAAITAEENGIALLPQPFVTIAQTKNENIRIALDLNAEWDKAQEGSASPSGLITGVVVARSEFIESNPEAVNAFLDKYKSSVEYVNSNIDAAADLIGSFDIVPAAVAKKALPYCNITFIEGTEMKQKLSGYLSVLMEQNPKAVGGVLPDDAFYYSR